MTASQFLKALAGNLRFYRKLRGLSQQKLSNKLNVNYRHLQNIEAGKVDPKLSTINGFARSFDVPACYLLENSNNHALKKLNLSCPSSILNMLNVGIQVNDTSGLVLYANKKHAETLGFKPHELVNSKYIWDFLYDPKDKESLKTYLRYLVENRPPPTTYYAKNIRPGGDFFPVKVEWDYIYEDEKLVGFLSVITYHPSW